MTRRRTPPTRTNPPRRTTGLRAAVFAAGMAVASLIVATGTPALAAPPSTLEMSSFVAEVTGHDIVGGVRTVTVVNPNDDPVDASFSLGVAPCDCVVDTATPSRGSHVGDAWDVGELGPGESATLTVRYVATPHGAATLPGVGTDDPLPWRLLIAAVVVSAGIATAAWAISAGYAPIPRVLGSRGLGDRRTAVA